MIGAIAGIAASAIGGGAGGGALGGALGGVLGGGAGGDLLGKLAGGVLDEVLGDGEDGAQNNLFDPLGLGLPSPFELLQQGPSQVEQLMGKQSPLDLILGGGQGGGPLG